MKKKKLKRLYKITKNQLELERRDHERILKEAAIMKFDAKNATASSLSIVSGYIKQIEELEDIHAVELNKEKERTISAKEFNNALREENQELKESLKETEEIVVLYSNELYKQTQNGEY